MAANVYRALYRKLLALHGRQGWWPLLACRGRRTGPLEGYHPGDFTWPRTRRQAYEVYVGAILAQNNSWTNAEQALRNLAALRALDPRRLAALDDTVLKEAIRPARYMNQKARYLRGLTAFFTALRGRVPSRDELLAVTGVGMETADSILLYAHGRPEFVVDAYTRRLAAWLGLAREGASYMEVKALFTAALPAGSALYNEYHALIVEHAQHYYRRRPYGCGDPLVAVALAHGVRVPAAARRAAADGKK